MNTIIKPFLRWAGGKSWLIKHLDYLLPKNGFKQYHEPFLGGGSIFLSVKPQGKYFLSDLNNDLIKTYRVLKNNPNLLINELKKYKNTEEFYYKIREREPLDRINLAAKFIYLNQTSFNGIYRVNLKGEYNVPFGYRNKKILDEENLRSVSKVLKKATLFHGDFDEARTNIKKGDLVFLDPPYTVSHNRNGFIKYNQKLFSLEDQHRLSSLIDFIKGKDAYYILTNAAHMEILNIFEKNDKKYELSRANLIGGINAERGHTTEYIFTNVK